MSNTPFFSKQVHISYSFSGVSRSRPSSTSLDRSWSSQGADLPLHAFAKSPFRKKHLEHRAESMAGSPQSSDASSPFSFQNQNSSPASLSRTTIIWLVVLACMITAAFIIITCLLCRCRRKRKAGRVSRGYSIYDGRHEFHLWNKNAAPVPAYGGEVFREQAPIATPSKAATRPAVMEPMVVEEASNDGGFRRSTRKASRYYGGLGARFSRMSQIGRAM